jgi:hypothetical protein
MFGDQAPRRRRLLMSGAALAVIVLVIWSMWPSTPAPSAASPPAAARGAAQQAGSAAAPVATVKLESLTAERQPPSETPRNPFRYQPKAPPPPPPRAAAPAPSADAEPARPAPPSGPPPPPPIPLKFIGIVTRANGVQWAVLSDGKAPTHGREGDIIDGRYRIVKIGVESIELTHLDGRGRQVIRLTGQ